MAHVWKNSEKKWRLSKLNTCACRTIFDWEKKGERLNQLKTSSEQAGFWNDPQQAAKIMQELDSLEKEKAEFDALGNELSDAVGFLELSHLDETSQQQLNDELNRLESMLGKWEFQLLLGGTYDSHNCFLTIRSGAGGTEAQDWAEILLRMYLRYCERNGYRAEILDEMRGNEAGIKSVTLSIIGRYAYGYLKTEAGVHRLVRLSPFNADHLRQTSFASVEVLPEIENEDEVNIQQEDLRIDTYRSSGAGGQHVNKTESAVRITHLPTGIVTASQNERSQLQNRATAMKMLQAKLVQRMLEERAAEQAKLRGEWKAAAFGNQIRSYVLHPYTLVKDHRTQQESTDAQKVLDGDLDKYIESALQYFYREQA